MSGQSQNETPISCPNLTLLYLGYEGCYIQVLLTFLVPCCGRRLRGSRGRTSAVVVGASVVVCASVEVVGPSVVVGASVVVVGASVVVGTSVVVLGASVVVGATVVVVGPSVVVCTSIELKTCMSTFITQYLQTVLK